MTGTPKPARRRVRTACLHVEWLDSGAVRFTSPDMPGWAAVARNPHELARAVGHARTEAEVAAYARWQGFVYDQDDAAVGRDDTPRPARPRRRGERRDVLPIEAWTPTPSGAWRSPKGQLWGPSTRLAKKLTARAREAGLPVPPPTA